MSPAHRFAELRMRQQYMCALNNSHLHMRVHFDVQCMVECRCRCRRRRRRHCCYWSISIYIHIVRNCNTTRSAAIKCILFGLVSIRFVCPSLFHKFRVDSMDLCISQTLCFFYYFCCGSVCEGIYIEKHWPHAHSITRSWFCCCFSV